MIPALSKDRWLTFQKAVADDLRKDGFTRPAKSHDIEIDLASQDSSIVIEIKIVTGAARDLSAGIMHLARACKITDAKHAIFAIWAPRVSAARVRAEWDSNISVLAPQIGRRLQLVMASPNAEVLIPDDTLGRRIVAAVRSAAERLDDDVKRPDRSHEVFKVLLVRWLRGDEPIAIGDLQRHTGLSHPSVSAGLRALGDAVERTTNRSVFLREFPLRAWERLVALAPWVRQSRGFKDSSGRPTNIGALVQRARRQKRADIAIGGVVAARELQPDFDLAGIPRLDLEILAPHGTADLSFVERLDPALTPASIEDAGVVLAVHVVARPEAYFVDGLADPVEVLLDLTDLRLTMQAEELMRHLRRRGR